MNEFKDYHLKPYLYKALNFIHFKNPTPVQEMDYSFCSLW